MRRIIAYLTLTVLIGIAVFAGYVILRHPVSSTPDQIQFVTRSGVDSTQVSEYMKQYHATPPQPEKLPIRWSEMTALIVSGTVAVWTLGFKTFKVKIFAEIKEIKLQLAVLADEKHRKDIDQQLLRIEQDVAGFTNDDKVRSLIEGMGSRIRSFCRDVLSPHLDEACLQKAHLKIIARNHEGNQQVKELGFSDYFASEIDKIRISETHTLMNDLTKIVNDKVDNSKYERQGAAACRFYKDYGMAVVKLSMGQEQ